MAALKPPKAFPLRNENPQIILLSMIFFIKETNNFSQIWLQIL